jgi:amino acid transporter, AAT family
VLGTILCAALLAACKMIIGPGTITALGSLIPVRRSAGRLLGRVDDHATLSATSRQDWGRPRTSSRAPSSRSHSLWGRSSSGYYVIADHLLHEPVVAGSLHGNALGFMDWFALITLLWVVDFGSYCLPRPLGEAGSEVDDAEVDDWEPSHADHLALEYKEISS